MATRSDAQWPSCFQPWPVQVTETETEKHMYTDEEILACEKWLDNSQNRDFKKWVSATVTKPAAWYDLELVICTALKVEPKLYSQHSKDAWQKVWDSNPPVIGKQRNTRAEHQEAGAQTAVMVLMDSKLQWLDKGLEWAKLAFTALAPRLNNLAKKQRKPEVKKDAGADDNTKFTKSTRSSKSSKSTATALTTLGMTLSPHPPALRPKDTQQHIENTGTIVKNKRQKIDQRLTKMVSVAESAPLPHKSDFSLQRPLCNRNIVVQLNEKILKDSNAIGHIVVGISVIVEDGAQQQHHADIHCNHLSWEKFKRLLEETDAAYNIQGARGLFWNEPSGVKGEEENIVQITNEADFRCAVGILEWNARQNQTEGQDPPLFMQIRNVYRY